jgi:HAD superfamily hydrolase (TIGR01450 family)
MAPPTLTFHEVRARHRALLIDAYGVLVDAGGALPGAAEAVTTLEREGVPWLLLTNDASRLPATNAARLRGFGLPMPVERVFSSGALLAPYFAANGLQGARCVVLGSDDSQSFVRAAGGEVVPARHDEIPDAVVLADDSGFPFVETLDAVLSMLMRAFAQGRGPALVLPNPDLIYPAHGGNYGFTAGTMAAMLEGALALRFPESPPRFTRLGKPSPVIFEAALDALGTRDAVMLGDQLHTDIAGARAVGIASALLLTGVTARDALRHSEIVPTYVMEGLS